MSKYFSFTDVVLIGFACSYVLNRVYNRPVTHDRNKPSMFVESGPNHGKPVWQADARTGMASDGGTSFLPVAYAPDGRPIYNAHNGLPQPDGVGPPRHF